VQLWLFSVNVPVAKGPVCCGVLWFGCGEKLLRMCHCPMLRTMATALVLRLLNQFISFQSFKLQGCTLWMREGSAGFHHEQLGHWKPTKVKDLFLL